MSDSSQRAGVGLYLDRLLGGAALIVVHEKDALRGHLAAAGERWRLARRARGVGELLRDQIDLVPESRNRLRRDHVVRRQLCRGLLCDLAAARRRCAGRQRGQ